MTLAFELAALQQTREPQAVVVDARQWAQKVGLTTVDSGAAHTFSSKNLVRRDFQITPTTSNFQHLHTRFTTERHVLVGEAPDRPDYLPQKYWEYLTLADAASAAGWELDNKETTPRKQMIYWLARVLRS
ncbi:DUF7124 domain-containing protein [Natrinema longum]|uniref:DUF7124 domain-containing protein n=1 Tax=Natrinema longum TaxID=370324 RepID=UPI001CCBF395|nr:hypothetical protein [Natrinema longum]MBZ6497206.1 hypothetical protein [Natrinema longum]